MTYRKQNNPLPAYAKALGLLFILALLAAIALAVLSGCASTLDGLQREQRLYSAGTNIVGTLQGVSPYLPQPAGYLAEAVLGAAAALLAAWNAHQQAQIRKLRNGQNGTVTSAPRSESGS